MTEASRPRANCQVVQRSLSPVGAVLVPTPRTPANSALWFGDGEERVVVNRAGQPIVPKDSGETLLSRWLFMYHAQPEFEIQASWFTPDGGFCQGLKARALTADILVTDRALRIGLSPSAGALKGRRGPWIRFDDRPTLSGIRDDCVYGAIYPLTDAETITGSRTGFAIGDDTASIRLQGSISRVEAVDGEIEFVKARTSDFATGVMDALLNALEDSENPAHRATAERYSDIDYAGAFAKRTPATYRLT